MRDKIFSIRSTVPVDPVAQLKWMLGSPLLTAWIFVRSIAANLFFIGSTAIGSHLGILNLRVAHSVVYFGLLAMVVTALSTDTQPGPPRRIALLVLAVCATMVLIVVLLLYLQFNAVGQSSVEGIQGRYFLPSFIVAAPFLPFVRPAAARKLQTVLAPAFAVVSSIYMVCTVATTYWTA